MRQAFQSRLAVVCGALAAFACGTDSSTSSSSSGASSSASSGGTTSGSTSGGASSGTSSSGGQTACEIPQVADASPAPGCATDDDCVVRMTGSRCCPQIAQAMTKAAAAANPLPTGPCECGATPCAPAPIPNAACGDGGVCVTAN